MDWFYYLSLLLVLLTGLVLNLITLPGLWLMVAGHAVYAWWTAHAGWPSVVAVLCLALAAEVAEFLAGAAGSATAGGTLRSTVGAIGGGLIGGIVGAPLPPPVLGAVAAACIGSFIGAAAMESTFVKRDVETATEHWQRAHRVGWGAFKGRLLGIILKTLFGVIILIVSLWTAWR